MVRTSCQDNHQKFLHETDHPHSVLLAQSVFEVTFCQKIMHASEILKKLRRKYQKSNIETQESKIKRTLQKNNSGILLAKNKVAFNFLNTKPAQNKNFMDEMFDWNRETGCAVMLKRSVLWDVQNGVEVVYHDKDDRRVRVVKAKDEKRTDQEEAGGGNIASDTKQSMKGVMEELRGFFIGNLHNDGCVKSLDWNLRNDDPDGY